MRVLTQWIIALFASPLGVVVLAALDSTVFFSLPLGIDAAVILLAARRGTLVWMVPILATAGSIGGAAVTFWMGRRLGDAGLERHVSRRRLENIRRRVRDTGAVALAVLDLIPPPFPFTPFVLAAGALEVDTRTFFVTLAVCRVIRFGGETILAVHYGPRIVLWLQSDLFNDIVGAIIVIALIGTVVSVARLIYRTRPASRRAAA